MAGSRTQTLGSLPPGRSNRIANRLKVASELTTIVNAYLISSQSPILTSNLSIAYRMSLFDG